MTTFAIVGGSGTVGQHITTTLWERNHEVRVLSRSSTDHPVDLRTGEGLASALAGVDVVIDASNGDQRRPEPVLVDGAQQLTRAAAAAGVAHLVLVSIVGIEHVPARYYRAKLAQEEIVRSSPVPWTIVRSTQFHELVAGGLTALGRVGLSPRSSALLQPVAALEAAMAIATVAEGPAQQWTVSVAGPEVCRLSDLARAAGSGRGPRLPMPLPLPPAMGRALRDGALTCPDPDHRGAVTFADWLRGSGAERSTVRV